MDNELLANTTLSHYRIVAKIGAGGMGEVYLAEDTKLDRKVALKILPPEFAEDRDRMSRFVREAKSASALNHPNIITIHEINEFDGTHFIATEFIDGKTLNEFAKSNPLNFKATLEIAIQIASALDEAHSAGIVHRDIKPDNVMVRANGLVKILDFGIAKLVAGKGDKETGRKGDEESTLILSPDRPVAPSPPLTSFGMIIGTANYMSPEQAKGKEIDARTDIFSFGVVLYEMVARRLPFAGETVMEMIGAILKDEPKPLDAKVPTEITKIISKCLRKDRDERYQTIKDVCNDLKAVKQELEFQNKLEKTISSEKEEPKTQILPAATAGEIQKTPTNETLASKPKLNKLLAAAIAVMLAIGGFFGYRNFTTTKQIESIAVMPFVNESGNADVEYLSDGMTETLISSLSNLPNLNVKPRSSVFRYKGKETNSQTIGKELNVQAILNGRVVQRGQDVSLFVELIDVALNKVVWSQQYNRKQADLVTLQSEVARDVSSKLKTKLSGADEAKVTKNYTANPEAYQLYLKGRFYWNKRVGASLKQAVEFYQQAIEKDPSYALAFSGLAETYVIFPFWGVASPRDSFPQAKAAAVQALKLDESLAEAHAALGEYLTGYAWNPAAGEKELRRAIELNPNYATAWHWLGVRALSVMGRSDEAIAAGRRAEELDPLSLVIKADLGWILIMARRYDEGITQLKSTLALDPNLYYARLRLGDVYQAKGMYTEAIAEYRKTFALSAEPWVKAMLARSLVKAGHRSEAFQLLNELKAESSQRYVQSDCLATVYAALGEKDEAFKWLEKGFTERTFDLQSTVDPLFDDLRADPRFADLVRRVAQAKMD